MHLIVRVLFLLSIPYLACSQVKDPDPKYKLLTGNSIIQSKNAYLLTLMEQLPEVRKRLEQDEVLIKLAETKKQHLALTLKECGNDTPCYMAPLKFSTEEIRLVSERLTSMYSSTNELGKLVEQHLIPSGTYILHAKTLPAQELLVKAWEQEARAINHILEVYAEGKKPNYPAIDSIAFKVHSRSFNTLVWDVTEMVRQEEKGALFFRPTLSYALRFLEANDRSEAADYEPMETTVNGAAFTRAKKVDWKNYKYTLILIPGAGPSNPNEALSAGGKLRCRVGALRYFEGAAPFIVVSGGRVHPYKTKYSEAYEMKKYLINELKVPEHAIIMDPHARHTTTNLRNCVRLLFRAGMPLDKPCLVSTMRSQSYYITRDTFEQRCLKEIGHIPYRLGNRLSETDFEFYPVLDALQIDNDEPLDP
ncbi:YdcF family protein [Telluribacter humicola]|uniref:YdcF family protein n=1 Tax=Telluribacter humicola TaxID=1720261 RepID=UPI001A96F5C9|nr:YdcF family protein [Telluribacter humicola]